jgi:hypothetical protein
MKVLNDIKFEFNWKNGGNFIENLFTNSTMLYILYRYIILFFSCLHICKDGERISLYVGCGKYLYNGPE